MLGVAKSFASALTAGTSATRSNLNAQKDLDRKIASAKAAGEMEKHRELLLEKQSLDEEQAQIASDQAGKFLSSTAGAVADAFIPGAGQFVTALLDLAKDPEAFRVFIDGFTEAIPEIAVVLAENMPYVAFKLAEAMVKIGISFGQIAIAASLKFAENVAQAGMDFGVQFSTIMDGIFGPIFEELGSWGDNIKAIFDNMFAGSNEAVAKMIQKATVGFTNLLNPIMNGFSKIFAYVSSAFSVNIGNAFSSFVGKLGQGANHFITQIVQGIPRFISQMIEEIKGALPSFSGGGGGGYDPVKQLFGGSDGLIVPPGFPNDSFPMRVESGEEVVSSSDRSTLKSDMEMLKKVIASNTGGGSQNIQVELTLDGNVLASTILELNRDNARLTA